jgi:hypothetical protein
MDKSERENRGRLIGCVCVRERERENESEVFVGLEKIEVAKLEACLFVCVFVCV